MSTGAHHIICGATTPGVFEGDHEHECHQPAAPREVGVVLKHKCSHCQVTWTERVEPRPAPDTSWVTTEPGDGRGSKWNWITIPAILGAVAAVVAILVGLVR